MPKTTTPKTEQTISDPVPPVVPIVPLDPGDAHGIGAVTEREIDPRYLHETAEEMKARGGMWGPV